MTSTGNIAEEHFEDPSRHVLPQEPVNTDVLECLSLSEITIAFRKP